MGKVLVLDHSASRSPSGISRAVIERAGDTWSKAVVVRLHLKGLENLMMSAGTGAVEAAVGVRDGKGGARQWVLDKDKMPLAAADPPPAGDPGTRPGREGGHPHPARRRALRGHAPSRVPPRQPEGADRRVGRLLPLTRGGRVGRVS